MSATWGQIMDALVSWASTEAGCPAIWANQNKPRPPKPYITLNIISQRQDGQIEVQPPSNGTDPVCIVGRTEFVVSVNYIAPPKITSADSLGKQQAQEIIRKLIISLAKESVMSAFEVVDVASIDNEGATDGTVEFETLWEDRAQVDIRFATLTTVVDDTGIIETVDVLGSFRRTDNSEFKDWVPLSDNFDSPSWK
jgi:hypothetical protein